jgi:amino acid adenylation domain-containing protein
MNPEEEVDKLEVIGEDEKHLILETFNETKMPYPKGQSVIERFEEIVERYPDRVALEFGDDSMTYAELNGFANSIAQSLIERGVQSGDVIGILAHRSFEMIISIYGILKAGGTYLPILPEYPKERIEYLLNDSGAKILLVSHSDLIGMHKIPTICVHEEMKNVSNNPKHKIDVERAVYIIYTSGTTGEPKGVVISNRNLQNLVTWQLKQGNISENSKILQNFTYVFDGSVWEIFCSGLSGASLQLISDEDQKNAKNLLEIIYGKRISHILIVPSMLRIITDYVQKNNLGFMFQYIQRLYIGGEALDKKLVEWFCESSGVDEEKLCNLYGPTEITVCATYSQISKGENITIGKPIGNTQALVMQQGNICGIGMQGELCIGGDGVSQGYLNREGLTREKFVVHDLNGNRLYRSGDLVRWLSNGELEYLGRIDEQVKIRGFRVELGEIENILRMIPDVKNAAVIVSEYAGDKKLGAYVVTDCLTEVEIREELKKKLPSYMLPNFITLIDQLPTLPNGKVDKRRLPYNMLLEEKEITRPVTNIEKEVASLYESILGIQNISIDDSFIDIGGHSIKAMQVVNAIASIFSVQIQVVEIMKGGSVQEVAKFIEQNKDQVIGDTLDLEVEEE